MNKSKWLVFAMALSMMAGTAFYLREIRDTQKIGAPGVRIGPVPLYGADGVQIATQSVILPDKIMGALSRALPITQPELDLLPKDTTFGRRTYAVSNDFNPMINVVLMGSDRTSIHQPQFCLVAQGWSIDKTEEVLLRMNHPFPYDITAMKLTTSSQMRDQYQQSHPIRGVYVYWFVDADRITPNQTARFWSLAKTMIEKRELERWAYITFFASCLPGQEQVTFERLERFMQASVPDFQVVAGRPATRSVPAAFQP
jgi:hypothetical protein